MHARTRRSRNGRRSASSAGSRIPYDLSEYSDEPAGTHTLSGLVTDLEPPERFGFLWGGDQLLFELESRDAGTTCLLRFTVTLDARQKAARDAAGWHVCLDRLAQSLGGADTTAPGAEPTTEWRELYEEYERRGAPTGAALPT